MYIYNFKMTLTNLAFSRHSCYKL